MNICVRMKYNFIQITLRRKRASILSFNVSDLGFYISVAIVKCKRDARENRKVKIYAPDETRRKKRGIQSYNCEEA